MDQNTIITALLGAAGAGLLGWPWIASQIKALFSKVRPATPAPLVVPVDHIISSVDQLSALVLMRQYLAHDSKAIEVIDTILAPAIMAASRAEFS